MKKYDIIMINPTFEEHKKSLKYCFPFGLLYLSSILKNEGYRIKLLDYNLKPKSINEIVCEIKTSDNPIFIISSMSSGYLFVKRLVPIIRQYAPKSKILLGGSITFGIPEFIVKQTQVDAAVVGEAETCIVQLVESILDDRDLSLVPGVYWRVVGDSVKKPSEKQETIFNLSRIPFPDWDLIDVETYISNMAHSCLTENMRTFPISASRGCPYQCNFCSKTLGSKIRTRSIDLIEEINHAIKKYHINDIWFIDEEFAITEERSFEMCDILSRLNKSISFVCSMRVDCVNQKILKKMATVGCRRIVYGVESGSKTILKAMNKKTTNTQADHAIIETRKLGIEASCNFMIGYPGETEETFFETFSFMKKHGLYSNFSLTTPLPGTPLFDDMIKSNRIDDLDKYLNSLDKKMTKEMALNMSSIPSDQLMDLRNKYKKELYPNRVILKS